MTSGSSHTDSTKKTWKQKDSVITCNMTSIINPHCCKYLYCTLYAFSPAKLRMRSRLSLVVLVASNTCIEDDSQCQ